MKFVKSKWMFPVAAFVAVIALGAFFQPSMFEGAAIMGMGGGTAAAAAAPAGHDPKKGKEEPGKKPNHPPSAPPAPAAKK